MIDYLVASEFWLQMLRFLLGSTILLSMVWLIEKLGLIQNYRTRSRCWRLSVVSCVFLLIPFDNSFTYFFYLADAEPETYSEARDGETIEIGNSDRISEDELPMLWSYGSDLGQSSSKDTGSSGFFATEDEFSNPKASILDSNNEWSVSRSIITVWLSISMILMIFKFFSFFSGLRNIEKRITVQPGDSCHCMLEKLCTDMNLSKVPRLTRSKAIESPITLLGNEICMPEWTRESLSRYELKCMLAHELGHIKHRDLGFLLGLEIMTSLFFFQPLFILASSRIRDISEFLADECALKSTGNRQAVVHSLVMCAEKVHHQREFNWSIAMISTASRLKQRVQHLQRVRKNTKMLSNFGGYIFAIGITSTCFLLIPSFDHSYAAVKSDNELWGNAEFINLFTENQGINRDPLTENSGFNEQLTHERQIRVGNILSENVLQQHNNLLYTQNLQEDNYYSNETRWSVSTSVLRLFNRWSNDYTRLGNNHTWRWSEGRGKWRGDIIISDSENNLDAISDEGFFEYQSFGVQPSRRIRYESDGTSLTQTYWLNGEKEKLDEDGRQWLHYSLVELMRTTGINVDRRIERMLIDSGPYAVIQEMEMIELDAINRIYSIQLVSSASLNEFEINQLLRRLNEISSDQELRLALLALSNLQNLTTDNLSYLIEVSNGIGSDLEDRLLISELVNSVEASMLLTKELISATRNIESDLEIRLALVDVLRQGILSDEDSWETFLEATSTISSDQELRILLSEVIGSVDTEMGMLSLISAAKTIDSDLEMRLALVEIIESGQVGIKGWEMSLDLILLEIGDSERAIALRSIADYVPEEPHLIEKYNASVKSVYSSEKNGLILL